MAEEIRPAPTQSGQLISIPGHYFNGLELGVTLSDINALLLLDGQPQARLNMSFTTAKTLSEALSKAVQDFEEKTGNEVMTMDFIGNKLFGSNDVK